MKTILVIMDGIGDKNNPELNNATPLEAALTPNLDWLAAKGKMGFMYPINERVAPESDRALIAIFGAGQLNAARGQLEAVGAGIKLERGDLALRTNFATIDSIREGKILDRRAGRTLTTKEASMLAKDINGKLKLPYKFIFKPTIQHRGVLVIKGGFSDNITNTDPAYSLKGSNKEGYRIHDSTPLDESENAQLSANLVNEFIEQSYYILKNHKVNEERQKKGLLPANIILTRDAGIELPAVKKLPGKWLAISPMTLEIGIAKMCGMDTASFSYPEMKDYDVYKNLYDGLLETLKFSADVLKKHLSKLKFWKHEKFYIHIKETDVPGHDGKPLEKKKMIEMIDKELFSLIRTLAEKEKIRIIVTGDHATPCSVKSHSADPVPFLLYGEESDGTKRFNEKEAAQGSLGKIYGRNALKLIQGS